jgi:hypothetical protein
LETRRAVDGKNLKKLFLVHCYDARERRVSSPVADRFEMKIMEAYEKRFMGKQIGVEVQGGLKISRFEFSTIYFTSKSLE